MEEIEVTVQSILPSGEPQGRFHLKILPSASVETLLSNVCKETNTFLKPEYSLRSKSNDLLERTNTLAESGINDGAFLHWTWEGVEIKPAKKCNVFLFLALISFLIGVGGILVICIIHFKSQDPVLDYAITFDAGSTHTSMFIYKWEGSKFLGTALAVQSGKKCNAMGHGIASYEKDPAQAGKSLNTCLEMAKTSIPSDKHADTPIYLGATAGMRLLNETNPDASALILQSVRDTFAKSPFKFQYPSQSVRIISGSDEGSFSWITSNYVTNAFGVERPGVSGVLAPTIVPSVGALDLGGASTQIAFVPEKGTRIPAGYSKELSLFGKKYTVYTHSFLCYGVMEMTKRIQAALVKEHEKNQTQIAHPCLPRDYSLTVSTQDIDGACVSGEAGLQAFGFNIPILQEVGEDRNITFYGESNGTQCRSLVDRSLFNFTNCQFPRCSFNGVYQPEISGPFYAFSSYYYVTAFLNLTSTNSSSFEHTDLTKAIDKICGMDWEQLQEIPVTGKTVQNLPWYCLQSTYIDLLLYDGYNFTQQFWPGIQFVEKVSNTEVGWSLGFVLNESLHYEVDTPPVSMYTVTFALLMVLFCLFIGVSLGLAVTSRRARSSQQSRYKRLNSYGAI